MRGDFSKLRFRPQKNYTSVLQQQGRVALDADANEQCAIYDYLRATETVDVVGIVGGPIHDEGFKITVRDGAIWIGKGRYYVDGILCENEHRRAYSDQPFLVDPDPTDQTLLGELQGSQPASINVIQVYLQVWRRLVTALDDPGLREPALGMADTTARLQTVWRVVAYGPMSGKTKPVAGTVAVSQNEATVIGSGTSFTTDLKVGQQIVFASDVTQIPYEIGSIASDANLTLATNLTAEAAPATTVSIVQPDGGCCKSMHLGVMPAPNQGKLNAQTSGDSSDCSCQPTPAAGYRGLENQLYRVEIHQSGDESTATFKWSRENGSVVVAITDTPGSNVVSVDSLGLDANLGFSVGDWVEITDDTYEFGQPPNKPGNLCCIQSITGLSVTMQQSVSVDKTQNPRMRRWDQFGSAATSNGVSLSTALVPLENGIEVEFTQGQYASGDYWLIPARTATGEIEWPPAESDGSAFLPPRRIEVFSAPLACIQWDTEKGKPVVQDCRKPFYPLTELTPTVSSSCCSYRVGDGVNTFGDFTSIQTAIDSLPDEGGEICILPGIYYENVNIVGCSDVVIHGCGWQTRVASASLAPGAGGQTAQQAAGTASSAGAVNPVTAVISIAASQHIKLRSFVVEAADDEAGVLIDGTLTSLTPAQIAQLAALDPVGLAYPALDVALEDMVFTAATFPAILAERVRLLRIERNRVAMKNVASTWPAIYASGTEIQINRNWVGIQSAANVQQWLPTVVAQDLSAAGSTAGSAAGASAGSLSGSSSISFVPISTSEEPALLNTRFSEVSASDLNQAPGVGHPGGIQIGGHSAEVLLVENEIQGGGRNGITLGSFSVIDANKNDTGEWNGVLLTGASDTATLLTPGTNPGTSGGTVVSSGILSNIKIQRNRISNMGLCGIGPVGFFDLSQTSEIITAVGLNISGNAISSTLRRKLVTITGAAIFSLAYGAVCISDAQNLTICDNTLTDFGSQPGAYVCGIYVLQGELVEISRNQVLETRDWSQASSEPPTSTGTMQGGIVLFGTPPSFPQPLDSSQWVNSELATNSPVNISTPIYEPGLPAVRIKHNVVRVPLGWALGISGLGPFSIVNNHLTTGGLVRSKGTSLAQTVYIINLGTAIETATAASLPSGIYAKATSSNTDFSAAPSLNFSCGAVLFCNNICQLEATASRQREDASVFIVTPDHLTFCNNHCWLDALRPSAFFDALLVGDSLSVVGNRFQEKFGSAFFSGLTIGVANITQENISTNCLLAVGLWLKHSHNIAFINEIVAGLCTQLQEALSGSK